MVIKLRDRLEAGNAHVHEDVFVGPDKDHLALVGRLVFSTQELYMIEDMGLTGEWCLFGVALALGAQRMNGDVEVILEGDEEVGEALMKFANAKEDTSH